MQQIVTNQQQHKNSNENILQTTNYQKMQIIKNQLDVQEGGQQNQNNLTKLTSSPTKVNQKIDQTHHQIHKIGVNNSENNGKILDQIQTQNKKNNQVTNWQIIYVNNKFELNKKQHFQSIQQLQRVIELEKQKLQEYQAALSKSRNKMKLSKSQRKFNENPNRIQQSSQEVKSKQSQHHEQQQQNNKNIKIQFDQKKSFHNHSQSNLDNQSQLNSEKHKLKKSIIQQFKPIRQETQQNLKIVHKNNIIQSNQHPSQVKQVNNITGNNNKVNNNNQIQIKQSENNTIKSIASSRQKYNQKNSKTIDVGFINVDEQSFKQKKSKDSKAEQESLKHQTIQSKMLLIMNEPYKIQNTKLIIKNKMNPNETIQNEQPKSPQKDPLIRNQSLQILKHQIKSLKESIKELKQDNNVPKKQQSKSNVRKYSSPNKQSSNTINKELNTSFHVPQKDIRSLQFSRTSSFIEYLQRNKHAINYNQVRSNLENTPKHTTLSGKKLYWHNEKTRQNVGKIVRRGKTSQKKQQQKPVNNTSQQKKQKQQFRIRSFNYQINSNSSKKIDKESETNQTPAVLNHFQSPSKNYVTKQQLVGKILVNMPYLKKSRNKKVLNLNQNQLEIKSPDHHTIDLHLNQSNVNTTDHMVKNFTPQQINQINHLLEYKKNTIIHRSNKKVMPMDDTFSNSERIFLQPFQSYKMQDRAQIQQINQKFKIGQVTPLQHPNNKFKEENSNAGISVIEDQLSDQNLELLTQKQKSLLVIPNLPANPTATMTSQQLINLGRTTFQNFNVILADQLPLNIKKYRNCVHFTASNKHILWHYSGKFYFGEWATSKNQNQGQKSGQGLQYLPDKYIYQGQFKDGKRNGEGIMKLSSGDVYKGQWLKGLRHGKGKLIQKSGVVYQGQWKQGKRHGYGKLILSATEVYQGLFQNGCKIGFGKESFKNGDTYQGNYLLNKFSGIGTYIWANKSSYTGDFQNGMRHGKGFWRSNPQKGDLYQGYYKNDKKCGEGKYTWENGTFYSGMFQNDLRHGEGILKLDNGKVLRAIWQNGIAKKKLLSENSPVKKLKKSLFKDRTYEMRTPSSQKYTKQQDHLIKKRMDAYQSSLAKIQESTKLVNKFKNNLNQNQGIPNFIADEITYN